jgi:antitoxin FitA
VGAQFCCDKLSLLWPSVALASSSVVKAITVRNVPMRCIVRCDVLAARQGRSAEAEIRDILERDVKPAKRVRVGDALAALGRKVGL